MLKQNNLLLGIALGVFLPIVALAILISFNEFMIGNGVTIGKTKGFYFSDKTIFVIAVCANLIPFNWYKNRYFDKTTNGIIVPTIVFVGLFFVWYCIYPEFVLRSFTAK
jgi:hypothetical protein